MIDISLARSGGQIFTGRFPGGDPESRLGYFRRWTGGPNCELIHNISRLGGLFGLAVRGQCGRVTEASQGWLSWRFGVGWRGVFVILFTISGCGDAVAGGFRRLPAQFSRAGDKGSATPLVAWAVVWGQPQRVCR